jgi:hypothetical protein
VVPARYDITIYQRATFKRQITLPIDLSGHEVFAQIWDSKRRNKIADFEINITNLVDGEFEMILDWEETTPLKKAASWDLMVVYADQTRDYWLEGLVTIDPGLTAPEDADA